MKQITRALYQAIEASAMPQPRPIERLPLHEYNRLLRLLAQVQDLSDQLLSGTPAVEIYAQAFVQQAVPKATLQERVAERVQPRAWDYAALCSLASELHGGPWRGLASVLGGRLHQRAWLLATAAGVMDDHRSRREP